jgi:hypothetical protein
MSFENHISISFAVEELQELDTHLTALEGLLGGKCMSLSPDQRKAFGRLGNRTENWVKKVVSYTLSNPELTPSFIDSGEMEIDVATRQALFSRYNRLKSITTLVDDTLAVVGYDLYVASLSYYRNLKVLSKENVMAAKTAFSDLSAQFPGRPPLKKEPNK